MSIKNIRSSEERKIRWLIGLLLFLSLIYSQVFSSASDSDPAGVNLRKKSLEIINNGLNTNPLARHDAVVWFSKGLNRNEVVNWASKRSIDLVSLNGSFDVAGKGFAANKVTVVLVDLVGYLEPLEEVIRAQIEIQHKARYSRIIEGVNNELSQENDKDRRDMAIQQISAITKIRDSKIFWYSAIIIANYDELNNLLTSSAQVKLVIVRNPNNANRFYEYGKNSEGRRKSIKDLKTKNTGIQYEYIGNPE